MRHPKGLLTFLFWLAFWCNNTQLLEAEWNPHTSLTSYVIRLDLECTICADCNRQSKLLTVFFFLNPPLPFKITVPSSVSGVTVNNSGRNDYLSVSWLPAPGDVDNYEVTLSHDGRVVQSLVIAKSVRECSFSSLTPGRLYTVTITTRSGKYENHSFSQERTGKAVWRFRAL